MRVIMELARLLNVRIDVYKVRRNERSFSAHEYLETMFNTQSNVNTNIAMEYADMH